jgi:hypothetical protein
MLIRWKQMIQMMAPQIHTTMVGGGMAGEDMAGEDIMDGKYSALRGRMALNVQEVSKGTVE